jgi:hypothetical protein
MAAPVTQLTASVLLTTTGGGACIELKATKDAPAPIAPPVKAANAAMTLIAKALEDLLLVFVCSDFFDSTG